MMSSKFIDTKLIKNKLRPSTFPENATFPAIIRLAETQAISEERLEELLELHKELNNSDIFIALASNEHFVGSSVASTSLLKRFAQEEDNQVKSALSLNPECPTEILEILSKNTTYYPIRTNVVKHKKCTFAMLQDLCKDGSSHVRKKIADAYNLPPLVSESEYSQILEIMSLKKDEDDEIKTAIVSNRFVKGNCRIFENILSHSKSEDVLSAIASAQWSEFNPDKINDILKMLSTHELISVQEAVANNASVNPAILYSMKGEKKGNVLSLLLRNHNFPFDNFLKNDLDIFINTLDQTHLGNLVLNQCLPYFIQKFFVNSLVFEWRLLIAESQLNMMDDLIVILVLDELEEIRAEVAQRRDLNQTCVKALATDEKLHVVEKLLNNSHLEHYHGLIREEMIKNQKHPRALDLLVSKLTLSPSEIDTIMNFERLDDKLLLSLIENGKQPISSEILHKLGTDLNTHVTVRTAIAQNKAISLETVKAMLKQERKSSKLYPVLKELFHKMKKQSLQK